MINVSGKQSVVTEPTLVLILESVSFKTASYKKDWKEIKENILKQLKENTSLKSILFGHRRDGSAAKGTLCS